MAEIQYTRLARARSRKIFAVAVMSRTSLWLGPDHLLFVESNGYTETYKRFYFRDIQAFTLQRTNTATYVNIFLAIVTLLFIVFGLVSEIPGVRILHFSVAGIFGLLLLLHAIPGASCKCNIKTAVQTEELSALARLRKARKVLDRVRPLITSAQGGALPPESIPDLLREMAASPAVASPQKIVGGDLLGVPPRIES